MNNRFRNFLNSIKWHFQVLEILHKIEVLLKTRRRRTLGIDTLFPRKEFLSIRNQVDISSFTSIIPLPPRSQLNHLHFIEIDTS